MGIAGLMRLVEEAKKSSLWARMREPSDALIRSMQEPKVEDISFVGMKSGEAA